MENYSQFAKKLLKLVLPIAFQQFMLALVGVSDVFMLGMFEQIAMSAVSLANQIMFVENLFFAALTIGFSILAAQYWGKKDISTIEKIFAYVMKITFAVSGVFCIFCFFTPGALMKLFTNDQELILKGKVYLKTVSLAFLLTGISQVYLTMLKNTGRAAKAGLISSVCVGVNIVLNAILIFGLLGMPKFGIMGAAIATVISRIVEVVWCIVSTTDKNNVVFRKKYLLHTERVLVKTFWKYTSPVLGNEIVWGCGITMFSVIIGHLGENAVAAFSISNVVKNLVVCFCIGLGSGSGIIIGNELGNGEIDLAKKYGKIMCVLSVICGILSGIILLALIPLIVSVTNLTDEAMTYLKHMLVICSYYLVGKSVNSTVIAGIFCAGGDSKFGFICDAVTLWGIVLPIGFAAAFVLKLPIMWVYFLLSLDEFIKLPVVYKHYKKYLWVKNLTV